MVELNLHSNDVISPLPFLSKLLQEKSHEIGGKQRFSYSLFQNKLTY